MNIHLLNRRLLQRRDDKFVDVDVRRSRQNVDNCVCDILGLEALEEPILFGRGVRLAFAQGSVEELCFYTAGTQTLQNDKYMPPLHSREDKA